MQQLFPTCSTPGCDKPARTRRSGLCGACYVRKWRQDNPEKARAKARDDAARFREQNPDYYATDQRRARQREATRRHRANMTEEQRRVAKLRDREAHKRYYAKNRDRLRTQQFAYTHDLSYDEAVAVLAQKPDGCECCERTDRPLYYDHCHQTKRHRGWLCSQCNSAAGLLQDDPAVVRRLAAYLGGKLV